jgi:hypothetical protein
MKFFHEYFTRNYNFLVALTEAFLGIGCKSNSDETSQKERVKGLREEGET